VLEDQWQFVEMIYNGYKMDRIGKDFQGWFLLLLNEVEYVQIQN
jgi:hypothetical protein